MYLDINLFFLSQGLKSQVWRTSWVMSVRWSEYGSATSARHSRTPSEWCPKAWSKDCLKAQRQKNPCLASTLKKKWNIEMGLWQGRLSISMNKKNTFLFCSYSLWIFCSKDWRIYNFPIEHVVEAKLKFNVFLTRAYCNT